MICYKSRKAKFSELRLMEVGHKESMTIEVRFEVRFWETLLNDIFTLVENLVNYFALRVE